MIETKAAPGYIINSQPIYFVVDPKLEGTIDHFDFENYQSKVIGQKVDGDGLTTKGLAAAEFEIYKQDKNGNKGEGPIAFIDKNGQTTKKLISDEQGKISATGLAVGNYLLVETKAPVGYVLATQPQSFEIKEQVGEPETIDLGEIKNYRGKIDISKVSEQNKPLTGGTFVLAKDRQGNHKVSIYNSAGQETTALHAIAGHIQAEGIQPGTYYLLETEAPDGFIINSEPIKVVIPDEVDSQTVLKVGGNLINYQGSAQLIKIDEDKNALAGAEFKVRNAQGKIVQKELISDQNGRIQIEQLAPGKYEFIEVKAPKGYQLSNEIRSFTIPKTSAGKPVVMHVKDFVNSKLVKTHSEIKTNTPSAQSSLPKTGEKRNAFLFATGLVILSGTLLVIYLRRYHKRD